MAARRNLLLLLLQAREAGLAQFRPILNRLGLTDQQWRILRCLGDADGALEPGQIAETCRILSPSLTGILNRLGEIGLILRERSPTDQRRQLVSLTAKGRALVDEALPLIDQQYALIEQRIGADALNGLYALLDRVIEGLGSGVATVLPAAAGEPDHESTDRRTRA